MNHGGHLEIQGRHNLIGLFDDGDIDSPVVEVLGDFHADKSAADNHGPSGTAFIDETFQMVNIRYVTQGENQITINSGYGRPEGFGSGR